jgi:hypothetical protein
MLRGHAVQQIFVLLLARVVHGCCVVGTAVGSSRSIRAAFTIFSFQTWYAPMTVLEWGVAGYLHDKQLIDALANQLTNEPTIEMISLAYPVGVISC